MLPFPRLFEYGNIVIPKKYYLYSNVSGFLFYDPQELKLYGRSSTGISIGINDTNARNVFTLTAQNVKKVLTTQQTDSMFFGYLSTDNKIMVCGYNNVFSGITSPLVSYAGWVDVTSIFTAAGIDPSTVKLMNAHKNTKISVVLDNGDLYCAGRNTGDSAFGDGTSTNSSNVLTKIQTLSSVKNVSGNLYLTNSGDLYCTGLNTYYQYGNGTTTSNRDMNFVHSSVQDMLYGFQTIVFKDTEGDLYACGTQFSSSLGNELGTGGTTSSPVSVLSTPTKIYDSCTNFTLCSGNPSTQVYSTDKILYSTGYNINGSFGTNNTSSTFVFSPAFNTPSLPDDIILMRSNTGLMIFSSSVLKLYQCGLRYGTGLGSSLVLEEVPLTFLQ